MDYRQEIEGLAQAAVELGRKGYVASHGGNLSMRVGDDLILITPTKVPKIDLQPEDIVIVDMNGKIVNGGVPTGETPMHTHLYRLRPDLRSLIHAHPPILTGFALTDSEILSRPLLPEPAIELGPILAVPYAEPVSEELARAFDAVAGRSNAWLMRNHGITIGCTERIHRTLGLLEMAEALANSVRTALCIGISLREIPRYEVERLERVLTKRGLPLPCAPGRAKSLLELYGL